MIASYEEVFMEQQEKNDDRVRPVKIDWKFNKLPPHIINQEWFENLKKIYMRKEDPQHDD